MKLQHALRNQNCDALFYSGIHNQGLTMPRARKAKKKLDAIALLKADHRKVEGLFAKFEKARDSRTRLALAREICTELTIHTTIEEEIFYPACAEAIEKDDLRREAYVEHDGAKVLVSEIETGGAEDPFFEAKVKVLSEQIRHHVKEEEKRGEGLLAQARKAGLDLDALGEQLAARKEDLKGEIRTQGLPAPVTRTFNGPELEKGPRVSAV
jgi:hemerythrin superfamily protein